MILDLQNFVKYKNIIQQVSQEGHPVHSSFYMDFENELAYFSNSLVVGRIKIEVDDEGEDLLTNMFIPVSKLIHLLTKSTKIIIDQKKIFHLEGGDTAKLSTYEDPTYEPPSFDLSADPDFVSNDIDNFEEIATVMKQAMVYADESEDSALHGIFFQGESIIGLQESRMYEHAGFSNLTESAFPLSMVRIMVACQAEPSVTIATTENSIQLFAGEDLVVQMGKSNKLEIFDTSDKDFVESYKHEDYVKVDREEFLNELNFLSPFFANVVNQRTQIIFEENTIHFVVEDEDRVTSTIKKVEYSDFSAFKGESRWISGAYLKMIATVLPGDFLIRFKSDSDVLDFDPEGHLHIIKSCFEDTPSDT